VCTCRRLLLILGHQVLQESYSSWLCGGDTSCGLIPRDPGLFYAVCKSDGWQLRSRTETLVSVLALAFTTSPRALHRLKLLKPLYLDVRAPCTTGRKCTRCQCQFHATVAFRKHLEAISADVHTLVARSRVENFMMKLWLSNSRLCVWLRVLRRFRRVLFISAAELDFLIEELSTCAFFDRNQWGMFTALDFLFKRPCI